MTANDTVLVETNATKAFDRNSGWDELLGRSTSKSIFLTADWLRTAFENFDPTASFLGIAVSKFGRRIAQAAFFSDGKTARFVGDGPSDYLDFILADDLDDATAQLAIAAILKQIHETWPGVRQLILRNLRQEHRSLARIGRRLAGWHAVPLRSTIAPAMSMSVAADAVRKKSLKRHENSLSKLGSLTCTHYTASENIEPRLPEFFDQHVRRWSGTPFPSPFQDDRQRRFITALVVRMAGRGVTTSPLRFTEIRLNGRLIAAHLGAFFGGTFTWYKPTFEPDLREHSPGEVLLKRLIQQAIEEGAGVFDFTIGDEAFKSRFATENPVVVDLLLTRSSLSAKWIRAKLAAKRWAKSSLERWNLAAPIKKLLRRPS